MESLDLQVCCIDDLLDFNINDDECGKPNKRPRNALSSVNRNGCDFDVFEAGDDTDRLFPVSFLLIPIISLSSGFSGSREKKREREIGRPSFALTRP